MWGYVNERRGYVLDPTRYRGKLKELWKLSKPSFKSITIVRTYYL